MWSLEVLYIYYLTSDRRKTMNSQKIGGEHIVNELDHAKYALRQVKDRINLLIHLFFGGGRF